MKFHFDRAGSDAFFIIPTIGYSKFEGVKAVALFIFIWCFGVEWGEDESR